MENRSKINKNIITASFVFIILGAGLYFYKKRYLNAESFGDELDKEDVLGYSEWYKDTPEYGVPVKIIKK